MTGPDHYREAEALLNAAGVATASQAYASVQLDEPPSPLIAAAQVHATLAAAAAQAMPAVSRYMGDSEQITEWAQVIGWSRLSPQDEAAELRAASGDEGPF